ncbi:MAG: methyltransferase [Candidatus Calescibacterium sp.]|nr:methyltransferase [Candidatus Calescibacterium sp.]
MVEEGIFEPRPETEILVEIALEYIGKLAKDKEKFVVVDACTGCGCIGISIARKVKEKSLGKILCVATDIDMKSLKLSRKNARDEKIFFLKTDLVSGIRYADMIVSNPPYVSLKVKDRINVNDPPRSLFGGEIGYEITEKLIQQSSQILRGEGILIFETGYDDLRFFGEQKILEQYKSSLFRSIIENGFRILDIVKDYSKIERILVLEKL